MSDDLKIMLVDESAFNFEPQTERDLIANAWFIAFLRDAQGGGRTIIVTDGCTETLKTKLKHINFSQAFVDDAKIDQCFLLQDIRKWSALGFDHVDVIMTDSNIPENAPDHNLHISSGSTYGPNSFHYWMDWYEENSMFYGANLAIEEMLKSLEQHTEETEQLLTMIYGDAAKLWNKIKEDPDVVKLTEIFEGVKHPITKDPIKDDILESLHGYFGYIVRQKYDPRDLEYIRINLEAYREGISHRFRRENIENKYPSREPDLPIAKEHEALVDGALHAIERIVQNEPAQLKLQ